ncbi:MAG TPA: glycosyltransferase family 4 protein [Acidimicrobiia bacterium]|nr:glycosyltransferase family 4 protein [Acidimicrobiia bacterium]
MFVKNSFEYDARVTKEAKTLIDAGHHVTVIAYHVPGVTAEHEVRPDGIEVKRISRVNLGVDALNRLAARYAGAIEERHSRLTGEPVDVERARREGRIQPPSTVAPGAAPEVQVDQPSPSSPPTTLSRIWGEVSTPILRSVTKVARFGFRVVKALLGRQGRALKTLAINRRMIRAGVAEAADVYHSHDLNTLYVGHVCKQRTGARLVYDSHELQTERSRMGFWWKQWALWNERRWLPSADALIVASPPWIDHIRGLYGHVPDPAVAVINTPEPTEVVPRDLRPELGLAPGTPLMLYQGSIQENRGIEPAIDAVERLDDVVLVIVGYGYYRDALEEMVARRNLGDKVRFFGPIPNHELLHWTASADVGLCNIVNASLSYYTTLPNKLFEYMMAEVPVLGSDSPGIGRVVAETGVGEVIDPVDPEAIAAATRKILADPEPYRAACRRARNRYNWQVESEKLLSVYERLK